MKQILEDIKQEIENEINSILKKPNETQFVEKVAYRKALEIINKSFDRVLKDKESNEISTDKI